MTTEPRARDILRELPRRRVVGERLVSRVGARAFAPPRFAKGRKMFARCGVPDPWDPDAKDVPLELGDIGLAGRKLPPGADPSRRMPAPHASPPALKSSARPGLPPRAPGPSSPSADRPAPRIGDVRPDDTARLRQGIVEKERRKVSEQSIEAARVRQPVKALPVRPDLAGPGAPGGGSTPVPVRPSTAAPRPGALRPPQRPDAPRSDGSRPDVPRPDVPRPDAARSEAPRPAGRPGMPPRAALPPRSVLPPSPVELPLEPPDLDEPGGPGDLGFARGRPSLPEPGSPPSAPDLPYPTPAAAAAPPASPPPSARPPASPPPSAPPRPSVAPSPGSPSPGASSPSSPSPGAAPSRAMPRPGGGNLDDLFGIGGGDNTRIRLGATEEARPRRPRVVDPAEAPGGIDRRPPPAKPPKVVASTPSTPPPRDEEPPE